MTAHARRRTFWLIASAVLFGLMGVLAATAPDFLSAMDLSARALGPTEAPPFGTDLDGRPLLEYAQQGAAIVLLPSIAAGLLVMAFATLAGLSRCAGLGWVDNVLQVFQELVGSLPRLVVVLVVALVLPLDWRGLMPIALTWALLAAPGAMDEAAATAGRLGGARFVEALRAHGFTATRIYLYHVVWLNLRAVIVRQGAEVMMQVVFLEIALSYLAVSQRQASLTHADSTHSWASLLYEGYTWLVADTGMAHAMVLGLALVAMVVVASQALRLAARPR